jgi:hypothetical protein
MPIDVLLWKGRRALIEAKKSIPREGLLSAGNDLLEKGLCTEALDFFKKAGSPEDIARISDKALEEGDYFLFSLSEQLLGKEPNPSRLARLAENAKARGLSLYEAKALERLAKVCGKAAS